MADMSWGLFTGTGLVSGRQGEIRRQDKTRQDKTRQDKERVQRPLHPDSSQTGVMGGG